jgi:hypothetical protein
MAKDTTTNDNKQFQSELPKAQTDHGRCEEVALRLFAERSVTSRQTSSVMILQCFKDARTFLDISEQINSGELSTDKPETRLSDACAPNLPPTHPMNFISQRFAEKNGGSEEIVLGRIKRVVDFLKANPLLGKPQDGVDLPGPDKVILEDIEVKGGEPIRVNWTVPDINTARLILPPIVKERTEA